MLQNAPPSWFVPIALGALFTVLAQMAPTMLAQLYPPASLAWPCCCTLEILPIGILPAFVALRRDPNLTAGQGFTVSFIACGMGSIVTAINLVLQVRQLDPDELREALRHGMEEMVREGATELEPAEIERVVEGVVTGLPYLPVVAASVVTLLAAVCGLATVSILRRRAQVPPHQGPAGQMPFPPQQPPPLA